MQGGRRTGAGPLPTSSPLVRTHRPDYRIVLFAGLLILIGLVVLFAISPYQIHRINESGGSIDQSHFMLKQLTYLTIGLIAFAVSAITPMNIWQRLSAKLVWTGIGLSVLLAVLGAVSASLAMCYNGACRWFDLGVVSFQPAELLKFALLIFMATFLARRMQAGRLNSLSDTLMPVGIILGVVAILVIGLQKDMGTGITIFGMVAVMLVVAGLRMRYIVLSGVAVAVAGLLFIVLSPHRIERILTFANASSDASSYHIEMAKLAIGTGGLVGRGLGNGVQAFGYLPEALNDSIFAVLGETFGFIGLVIVLVLFMLLLREIITMVDRLNDPFMRLIVAGVFGWLATHIATNIGAMTGIFPLTGVTLPFLSFGGTSLLMMMAALGLAYNVSRYTSHRTTSKEGEEDEATRSRRGFRRARDAGTRRYQRA